MQSENVRSSHHKCSHHKLGTLRQLSDSQVAGVSNEGQELVIAALQELNRPGPEAGGWRKPSLRRFLTLPDEGLLGTTAALRKIQWPRVPL